MSDEAYEQMNASRAVVVCVVVAKIYRIYDINSDYGNHLPENESLSCIRMGPLTFRPKEDIAFIAGMLVVTSRFGFAVHEMKTPLTFTGCRRVICLAC